MNLKLITSYVLMLVTAFATSANKNSLSIEKVDNRTLVNSTKANLINKESLHLYQTTISPDVTTSEPILPDWGGNCTKKHWAKCAKLTVIRMQFSAVKCKVARSVVSREVFLKKWSTKYPIDKKKPELGFKYHELNCTNTEPKDWLCLTNGWTVTRCQLLCMRCNKEIFSKYEKFVAKKGAC